MKILIITPAPPQSKMGNRVTAIRWSRILRQLGHKTTIAREYSRQACDIMVALHARRSANSVAVFRHEYPERPLILALSGTDLYGDIRHDARAQRSLELADRLVLLQPHGMQELSRRLKKKACVIFQSMSTPTRHMQPLSDIFEVCVIGHLRPVKDPFRAAMAVRQLPAVSRIRVVHLGAALSESMDRRARAEMKCNPRYHWLGELPRGKMMQRLARSRMLVLSSKMEGGANAVSEAIVCGVPVISSRISGSIGLLGDDYPGYFEVGDTRGLSELLDRAENDFAFLAGLTAWCERLKPLFDPAKELNAWRELLDEFSA